MRRKLLKLRAIVPDVIVDQRILEILKDLQKKGSRAAGDIGEFGIKDLLIVFAPAKFAYRVADNLFNDVYRCGHHIAIEMFLFRANFGRAVGANFDFFAQEDLVNTAENIGRKDRKGVSALWEIELIDDLPDRRIIITDQLRNMVEGEQAGVIFAIRGLQGLHQRLVILFLR